MSPVRILVAALCAAAFLFVHFAPLLASPAAGPAPDPVEAWQRWGMAGVAWAGVVLVWIAGSRHGGLGAGTAAAAGLAVFPGLVDAVGAPAAAWPAALALPAAPLLLLAVRRSAAPTTRLLAAGGAAGLAWLPSLVGGGTSCAALEPAPTQGITAAVGLGALVAAISGAGPRAGSAVRVAAVAAVLAALTGSFLVAEGRVRAWTSPAEFWARAVEVSPASPLAWAGRAVASLPPEGDGAPEPALRRFTAVVRSGGGATMARPEARRAATERVALAVTSIARRADGPPAASDSLEAAIAAADAALLITPGSPVVAAARGEALLATGDAVAASAALAEGAAGLPADADVLDAFARALLATGRFTEAVEAATRATGLRPGRSAFVATFARALAETGRGPDAVTALHRALGDAPSDGTLLRAWGDVHLRLALLRLREEGAGRGRARRMLLTGLRLDPRNSDAAVELARLDALREAERPDAEALLRPAPDGTVDPDRVVRYAGWLGRWGDFEAAGPVWDRLLQGRGGSANLHFQIALEFWEARETVEGHEEAVRAYRKALVLEPGLPDARDRLWRALLTLGRTEEARTEAARFVREHPSHPGAVEAERLLAAAGPPRDGDAIRVRLARAERNLALHGVTMSPRYLGNAVSDYSDIAEALRGPDRPPGLASDAAWEDARFTASFSLAFCLAREEPPTGPDRGPYLDRLEAALQDAATLSPEFFGLWIVDGMAQERLGNAAKAVASLDTGLRLLDGATGLQPWQMFQLRLFGLLARGRAHLDARSGREDLAVADFRAAAALAAEAVRGPEVPREGSRLEVYVLTHLAAAQMEMNQYVDAEATLDRLLREDPGDPRHAYHRAVVAHRQEKYDEALEYYRHASRMDPRDPRPHLKIAYILLHPGRDTPDPAAALAHAEIYNNLGRGSLPADRRGPPTDEYSVCRGEAARLLGNPVEAERWLRAALELNPHCRRALQGLIRVLRDGGGRSGAGEAEIQDLARRLAEENRQRNRGETMDAPRGDQTFCLADRAPSVVPA